MKIADEVMSPPLHVAAVVCAALLVAVVAGAADCASDPQSSFPLNLMGQQIFGLGSQQGGSQADCAAACCNDTACNVYSWCPANSLACGKQSPTSTCMTGASNASGSCSTDAGAEWCNWYSYGKASCPDCAPSYPNCSAQSPPTPPDMPRPPRLPSGVPSPSGRAGDGWGVDFHANEWSGAPEELDQVAAAFRVVRLDMPWGSVESVAGGCGAYNFSAYDAPTAAWIARGVQPLYILDYWSDCYDGGSGCASDACADAYASFGAAAMAHFGAMGAAIIFECQNEPQGPPFWPNADPRLLARMCYGVRAKAAAAGSLQYWTGPTTSWFDYVFLTASLESCIFNAFHAWSIHPYTSGAPESRIGDMRELSDYVWQASGGLAGPGGGGLPAPLPVASSEWGYTSASPAGCDPASNAVALFADQGKFLARMMLSQTMLASPYSIWYDWKNDSPNYADCESNFGAVNASRLPDGSYAPKPAYMAALAAQTTVGNGSYAGRVAASIAPDWDASLSDVFVLQFNGANAAQPDRAYPAFAVWTNISMCGVGEGPRYPCPGAPDGDLYACLAAGCCFDETAATNQCHEYLYADQPLQVQFAVPEPADPDACFTTMDFAGYLRAPICSQGGVLTVNVTDGPTYLY